MFSHRKEMFVYSSLSYVSNVKNMMKRKIDTNDNIAFSLFPRLSVFFLFCVCSSQFLSLHHYHDKMGESLGNEREKILHEESE
jgi:hypothetical protein